MAWNSAVFDTTRNRLIIWGGGHNDYYGNEIYALDLDTLVLSRLTDPGLPIATSCTGAIAGGTQANSRHTYDGIEYVPNVDKMFVFGGAPACPAGGFVQDTWMFNFAANRWEAKSPSGPIPSAVPGIVTAYDPNTGKVFLHDTSYLYSYDPNSNSFTRLSGYEALDYHLTAAIDPSRKKFVIVGGGGVVVYDIGPGSAYPAQRWSTTGGSAIESQASPGLAYDPVSDRIVGWSGGNTVYSLNMDTRAWTSTTYSGGPGSAIPTGTFGRWQYSPTSNVFVTINSVDSNAYTFRLTTGGTPPPVLPDPPKNLRMR